MNQKPYPVHYCNTRHNPKYPCPQTEARFGGVPANRLPSCFCEGVWHEDTCPRRLAIERLAKVRQW